MAKNALVKRLESTFKFQTEWWDDTIFCINFGTECCGIAELCGIDYIPKELPTRQVHAKLMAALIDEGGTAGIIICTSTKGRVPQLEKLGFKLVRKEPFVNGNSGNKIHMYQILGKDIEPSAEVRKITMAT